ncbi:MAG: hypothetical protein JNK26_03945 [Candidatus Doudnabacteria bacterium]|nr:hypothetical protein [Candidatus Doudnabacteria bacterium]
MMTNTQRYLGTAFALIVFSFAAAILPLSVIAQDLPEGVDLPQGVIDQSSTSTTTSAEGEVPASDNATRTQDFVTGVAVGAAIGVIVGGGTIWFTKKG